MTWEIKNRFSGTVMMSGDGNLRDAYLRDADLRGADLGGADLRGAYLRDAYLGGADLRGAYLRDADLRGAYLGGAYLRDAKHIIDLGQRSDGYQFYLHLRDGGEPFVLAGCRYMRLSKAKTHWDETRPKGTKLGDETRAILKHGERLLKIRRAAE